MLIERPAELSVDTTVSGPEAPTYLAAAPGGRVLYAVHELDDGLVSAYAVPARGKLRLLGMRPLDAAQPCHISMHPGGRHVYVSNWGSGSFVVVLVDSVGALGPPSQVIENPKPHAHMMVSDQRGRWVLGVHLGAGTVSSYEYVLTTACAFDLDGGRLEPGETISTVPSDFTGDNFPSAIRLSADGRFVYVANRGHDSIAVISTEPSPRLLATFPCGGEFPKDIAFSAEGRLLYVANERSDLITVSAIDRDDGGLAPTGQEVAFPGPTWLLPV